jgi:CheY-like chemotaxis protein
MRGGQTCQSLPSGEPRKFSARFGAKKHKGCGGPAVLPPYGREKLLQPWVASLPGIQGEGKMVDILVVEDELGTRNVIANVLRGGGHHVLLASTAVRALCLLEDNPSVEMVITDVIMPTLDGREFVATLQRDPRFSKLPVLIMSATVGVAEISKLLKAGATRFLAKPVRKDALLSEVGACLRHSGSAGAPSSEPAHESQASGRALG